MRTGSAVQEQYREGSGDHSRACQAGHRVAFATASEWVDRLAAAHHAGRLQAKLTKLGRYPLIVIDEVGCAPRLETGT
ncbi:ATP-binding protein [Streptomyces sp. RB17]|uniref:ATP-binding protein n=1 Tax=Streptomyces sp. RB17 TaxID=2585197 RepID=UPI002B2073FF|nr:ATP-binding protein [Streptomyces sp. RB17]